MADIEELLTEAGERWRAGQPPVPDLQAPIAQRPVVRPRLGALIVVVALLAVIAFVGTSPVGGPAPSPSPSHVGIGWDQAQLEAAIVHAGDRVTAKGVIIAPTGEAPKLCEDGIDLLIGDPPACLPIAVPVDGVDFEHLPGRKVTKGTISSAGVEVHGSWTGTAIRVESIGAIATEPYSLERSACPEPQGGWPSAPSDLAFRAALDPLVGEITAKPEIYGAYWTVPFAVPDVEVVETRVDPATVRGRVDALFPFSACLLRGTFTSEELTATATALQRDDLTWIAGIEEQFHRVRVQLTMLDEAAVAVFVAHPDAYPAPLVTRDSPGAAPVPTTSVQPDDTASSTATPQPSLDLVDGLPLFIDGEQVLVGDLARVTVQGVRDGRSFLVGGWVHAPQVRSCPAMLSPDPWNACAATRLFPSPFDGPEAIGIYRGLSGPSLPTIPDGSVQPVVLRVHTHDAACTTGAACTELAVLDAVVWQGGLVPTPTPTNSAPPGGVTLPAAAVEAANRVVGGNGGSSLVVTAVVAGPYAIVGPAGGDVAGDRWVWAVTLTGTFIAPDCPPGAVCLASFSSVLVVLDYVDGSFLVSASPAPFAPATPDSGSRDAMTVVSKFELARASGSWDDAWKVLAPWSQRVIGSQVAFVSDEMAYNVTGGAAFSIVEVAAWPFDTGSILPAVLDDIATVADVHSSFLVTVRHPDFGGASVGTRSYIAARLNGGGWRIWIVH
jgi:hypothetical protein